RYRFCRCRTVRWRRLGETKRLAQVKAEECERQSAKVESGHAKSLVRASNCHASIEVLIRIALLLERCSMPVHELFRVINADFSVSAKYLPSKDVLNNPSAKLWGAISICGRSAD